MKRRLVLLAISAAMALGNMVGTASAKDCRVGETCKPPGCALPICLDNSGIN